MKWIQGMQRQSQALYYLLDWIRNLEYLATVMKPTIAELWNTQCSLVINFLNEKHREHGDLLDDLILQFISIGDSFAILLRHEFGSSELSFISCLVRSRSLHLSLSFPTEFLSRLFVLCSRLAEYPDKSDLVMTFVALFLERDHPQKWVLEPQINKTFFSESSKECEIKANWLIKLAGCISVQRLNQFLPQVPVTMELLPSLLPKLRDDCVSGMHADVQGNIISIMRDYYRTQCNTYCWNQHNSRFKGSLFDVIENLRARSSETRGASAKTLRFFGLEEPGDCGIPHQLSARARIS